MRRFYDLLVSAELLAAGTLEHLRELGFSGVGASLSIQSFLTSPVSALRLFEKLKDLGKSEGMDVVSRLTVDCPISESLAKRFLRKWRRRVELISVHTSNRQLTALASRDTRVDILTLVPGARLLRGDLMYVEEHGKRVEFLLAPLQEGDERTRARVLAYYIDMLSKLSRSGTPRVALLLSSGSSRVEQFRDPRSMAALFHALGVSYEHALDAVSRNASELVDNCRGKLSGEIPVRGVRIVRKGEEG